MNDAGATDERDTHGTQLAARLHGAKPKPLFKSHRAAVLLLGLLSFAAFPGCSTPGKGHAYLYSPALAQTIRDIDPLTGAERAIVPSFIANDEPVQGMAYDPYTDHFFIRLFPGNRIRVIDRPAGAVKRNFTAPNLPLGGCDLAIRSRDRHLFFTDPNTAGLFETSIEGVLQNYIHLEGLTARVWGVAHDALRDELLVLPTETSNRVHHFTPRGVALRTVALETPVQGRSLAFDSDAREYFASLADGSAIGVFDPKGRLLRRLPRPSPDREVFIDVGPRSLLRLF